MLDYVSVQLSMIVKLVLINNISAIRSTSYA